MIPTLFSFFPLQYGGIDKRTGKWNGAIKQVLDGPEEGGSDFAVLDLSITSDRAKVVSFSMPFLNLGKLTKKIRDSQTL
jgi:hypothetical protein